jgi:hypothetical protein
LSQLQVLDLSESLFTAPFPDTWQQLQSLTTLNLSGNPLGQGPEGTALFAAWLAAAIPSLQTLSCRRCSLAGTVPWVANATVLPNLRSLELAGNAVVFAAPTSEGGYDRHEGTLLQLAVQDA